MLVKIMSMNPVRTSTPHFTITEISWLMAFKATVAVYSDNHTKHKYKIQRYRSLKQEYSIAV
jgi:hypothetical protein